MLSLSKIFEFDNEHGIIIVITTGSYMLRGRKSTREPDLDYTSGGIGDKFTQLSISLVIH